MKQDDLLSLLFVGRVDPEELSQVVLESLGAAAYESENEVIYRRPGQHPALRFFFAEDRIRTVEAGPGLSVDDISSIRAKIKKISLIRTGKLSDG